MTKNDRIAKTGDEPPLVEASTYLGIHRRSLWKHARSGLIPYRIDPDDRRRKLFRRSGLDQLERPGA